MKPLPWWQRVLSAISVMQIAVGVAIGITAASGGPLREFWTLALMLTHAVVYASAGWVLIAGGDRDDRAVVLGTVFLLTGSSFTTSVLRLGVAEAGVWSIPAHLLLPMSVDAFTPYFLWRFVGRFPRGPDFGTRYQVVRAASRVSLLVGAALLLLNAGGALVSASAMSSPMRDLIALFSRGVRGSGYWPVLLALSLPTLGQLWTGRTRSSPDERRRVALLALGLVLCAGPTFVYVFVSEMWPPLFDALPVRVAGFVLYPLLLFLPIWTTYVVRVHHALDVRLVARQAVQYALARQTAALVALVPFVVLAFELYSARSLSVSALLTGSAGVSLGALVVLGVAGLRGHRELLDRLDRRYFREQYDARQILGDLVERCGGVRSRAELAEALRSQLARALHPESARLLFLDDRVHAFTASDGTVQPLEVRRPLLQMAEAATGAFDTDLERPGTEVDRLPEADRAWVLDSGAKLCVPLKNATGALVGLILLGEKKSDLPYSEEDRRWLNAVGAAAAMALNALEAENLRSSGDPLESHEDPLHAVECLQCGSVFAPAHTRCEHCHGALRSTELPLVVSSKFRLIQRIGDGAMGVVYRGLDVQLSRAVAIKTLPRLQASAASRLRREARVIASVSHPNLAAIYGVESWRGLPMLVLELLAGGTLAERIARGSLPTTEVLQLGMSLSEALAAVHRAGILHRDVKPSNIGFSADGVPKLLDFGVSRLLGRATSEDPGDSGQRASIRAAVARTEDDFRLTTTADGRVVGTPLYLSPEAMNGERPEPSFDVWSLCIVLYESMAGQHPLMAPTMVEVMARISRCDIPDIRVFLPGASPALSGFFERAFSPHNHRRPQTALELREQIQNVLYQ